jgi:NAD(P)-dependent dehydrogenase (short-subunit alcohol dehydrogenase family)
MGSTIKNGRAVILGARPGNIGQAIASELLRRWWEVSSTDCLVDDGTRPPGGNLPNDQVAVEHGYSVTEKGRYGRYDVPSLAQFERWDADALVVSLGSTYKTHFTEVPQHDIDRVMRACLLMPLEAARRYVQAAEKTRREINEARKPLFDSDPPAPSLRRIVFIGSYAHNHPFTNGTAYCAAKAGIDMAAKTLAWELTDRGYRVHVVHPWHVKGTPMWKEVEQGVMESKGWTKEEADAYADRDLKMPTNLTPEDVAKVVATLLNTGVDNSLDWMAGTSIELAGGTR